MKFKIDWNKFQIRFFIISLVIILAFILGNYKISPFSFSFSDMIILILTSALVIATIYYAQQTEKMAQEMELARKNDFLPYLKIRPTSYYSHFSLEIENVGRGVAKDVEISIKAEPSDIKNDFFYPYIYPREKEKVLQPFLDKIPMINDIIEKFKFLRMTGKCKDIIGNEYSIDDTFDIEKWKKALHGKFIEYNPIEVSLEHIERAIESIERKIK